MKIKSKIDLFEKFIQLKEDKVPIEDEKNSQKELDPNLKSEIDVILDKLKELEINLDSPPIPSETSENNILETSLLLEEPESYNDGYAAGKSAIGAAKVGAAVVGGAIAIGALLTYAYIRSNKRIKKRIKAYAEHYPKLGKLEVDKKYTARLYNMQGAQDEETNKKIDAFKEKVQQKIDAVDDKGKKDKIRELRDKKIVDLKGLIAKKYDAKKESYKEKLEKDVDQLKNMWTLTLQETDVTSFFDKLQQTEGQSKMNRKWEEGKLDIEKTEDAKLYKYEKTLLDKIYKDDEEQLDKSIENLDVNVNKQEESYKEAETVIKKKEVKEKEIVDKRKNEETEKENNNPKYKEAKAEEQKFQAAEKGFTDALIKYNANQSKEYKDALTKAHNKLKVENNLTGKGTKVLKNDSPPATPKQLEVFAESREKLMGGYKQQYDSMVSPKKKETKKEDQKENRNIKITKKLNEYSKFKVNKL